jgi:hypothetical protein
LNSQLGVGVPRGIHQRRDGDSRDIFVGRWGVAAIAEDPGKDAEMRRQTNRHHVVICEETWVNDRMRHSRHH